MLKKEFRVPSFKLNNPNSYSSKLYSVKFSSNNLLLSRFGFVISKKFDKRAVVRNDVKRKVRSCIEEIFDNIKPGYDIIFYPKQEVSLVTRQNLLQEIEKDFKKLNLINE